MSKEKTALDKAFDVVLDQYEKDQAALGKMSPLLNEQLYCLQRCDNSINWHEQKIKEMEATKQVELAKMRDLLELAETTHHTLKSGYTVKPDHKRKTEVTDIAAFLKWLKMHKTSTEILEFFTDALKLSNLKEFCNKEANAQRLNGEINPHIDGITFEGITYNKLTTTLPKKKKEKK